MAAAYATTEDLDAWVDESTTIDSPTRLLARATELVDSKVVAWFDVSTSTQLPTDATVAAALRDAVCAQVEFWHQTGEDHDILGLPSDTAVAGEELSVSRQPPELAPRARRLLASAGLLGAVILC